MDKTQRSIAVVGASADRSKMSNKAVRAYKDLGYFVFPVHPKESLIEELTVYKSLAELPARPDIITLYLPPAIGIKILPEIARLRPSEFYVNPGAESDELMAEASKLALEPIYACSIESRGLDPEKY